jgi:hypothetical protein
MLGARRQVLGLRRIANDRFPEVVLIMRETLELLAQAKGLNLSSDSARTLLDDAVRETQGRPKRSPAAVAELVENLPASAPD